MSNSDITSSKQTRVRHTKTGVVIKANSDKTRRVMIEYLMKHDKYGKYIKRRTVMAVHDEKNLAQVGDKVEIMPCRPVSKTKKWKLIKVLESTAV